VTCYIYTAMHGDETKIHDIDDPQKRWMQTWFDFDYQHCD